MSLDADQKEKIMASRGQSSSPTSLTGTRRYTVFFADGKTCTVLDMQNEPVDEFVAGVKKIFHPGYAVSVELQNA